MNRKRTYLEIIEDILKVIGSRNGKAKPTHILYKSNLSYQMMREYLDRLIEKGFVIQKSDNGKTYFLTNKGYKFIQEYKAVRDITDSLGFN